MGGTLLLVTGRSKRAVEAARSQVGAEPVTVLRLDPGAALDDLPAGWRALPLDEVGDLPGARRAFLSFLDNWPRQSLWRGGSFNALFTRRGGYSVWWTGPGRGRHPNRGAFPKVYALWLADRAIRAVAPRRVLVYTRDRDVAALLASRCAGQLPCDFLPGTAVPAGSPWIGRGRWLARSLARLPLLPVQALLRAALVRVFDAFRGAMPVSSAALDRPAVVMVCELSRDLHADGDGMASWFWEEVRSALATNHPQLSCRYRMVHRRGGVASFPAWRTLHRLKGGLPSDDRHPALASWCKALPGQVASLFRYYRLERSAAFRGSFQFAGGDLAPLYVPDIRRAIARSIDWAQEVGSAVRSLRSAGRIAAMMVVKEMYPSEMVTIAAAREAGIPTVGVQHGTISPAHLIYTIPPGYVEGAPVPDFFAVYGEFAKETVSGHGAYPSTRVWVTGAARFDALVRRGQDRRTARARLGLPLDARILLITTQSSSWFPDVVRAVIREARVNPDWVVCIKTHPLRSAHVDVYGRLAGEAGTADVRLFGEGFYDLLSACDVLIGGSSTTVLEAILADRHTICVNFSREPDPYPYADDGGSLPARSPAELREALATALTAEASERLELNRKRFLQRHLGPGMEGRAAETLARRVAALATAADGPVME